jgi:hypothetical protein
MSSTTSPDPPSGGAGARARADSLSSSDEDGSMGEWSSSDGGDPPIRSFLGAHALPTLAEAWAELKVATGFDVPALVAERGLGDFERVRLANYLRATSASAPSAEVAAQALRAALAADKVAPGAALWTDERWLVPALEDDALLMAVLATGAEEEEEEEGGAGPSAAAGSNAGAGGASPPPRRRWRPSGSSWRPRRA